LRTSLKANLGSHPIKHGGPPPYISSDAGAHDPLVKEGDDFWMAPELIQERASCDHIADILGVGGTRQEAERVWTVFQAHALVHVVVLLHRSSEGTGEGAGAVPLLAASG
jgi:hypothetical protein